MLASSLNIGFSASSGVSTLVQREEMVKEAFLKSPEEAVKFINEKQKDVETVKGTDQDKVKADAKHYVVVIKIEGDKYIRVAHFKESKIKESERVVEQSLIGIMDRAKKEIEGKSGPIFFSFSVAGEELCAVLSKRDDYLIFNICPIKDKAEVEGILNAATAPVAASAPADSAKDTSVTPVTSAPTTTDAAKADDTAAAAAIVLPATEANSENKSTDTKSPVAAALPAPETSVEAKTHAGA